MIRAAAHTHRGLARVPVVPHRAHAVSGRLAACIAARGASCRHRARTVSDGGFVRAVRHTPYTCRHRHSAPAVHTQELHTCCPCHQRICAAAHTHRGLARVPVVPYRAHAVGGRLAACTARGAVIAAARACTVSDGGFVRAVSTRRTRAAIVIACPAVHTQELTYVLPVPLVASVPQLTHTGDWSSR